MESISWNQISSPPYRETPKHNIQIEKEIQKLQRQGRVCPSRSPYTGSVVVVIREGTEDIRHSMNYRKLNRMILANDFSFPSIEKLLFYLNGAQYVFIVDFNCDLYLLPLRDKERRQTDFSCSTGKCKSSVRQFGISVASTAFQSYINSIFAFLEWKTLVPYIDDVIIWGNRSWEMKGFT